jgi:trehalose 6-phosphate phosphatase
MPGSPKPWARPEDTPAFFTSVRQGESVLMLDYDGTLAPFTANRFEAIPYPGVHARLETLLHIGTVRLILVTGRPAQELHHMLKLSSPLEIWGSHGREHRLPDGSYTLKEMTPAQMDALRDIADRISRAGFGEDVLERKPASLAIHWRALDPAAQQRLQHLALKSHRAQDPSTGLTVLDFESGLEIRRDDITKGDAVRETIAGLRQDIPVAYLGDDLTDEDAFRVLRPRGLTMLVREQVRETVAEYWLRPPDRLLVFLDAWIDAAAAQTARANAAARNA